MPLPRFARSERELTARLSCYTRALSCCNQTLAYRMLTNLHFMARWEPPHADRVPR